MWYSIFQDEIWWMGSSVGRSLEDIHPLYSTQKEKIYYPSYINLIDISLLPQAREEEEPLNRFRKKLRDHDLSSVPEPSWRRGFVFLRSHSHSQLLNFFLQSLFALWCVDRRDGTVFRSVCFFPLEGRDNDGPSWQPPPSVRIIVLEVRWWWGCPYRNQRHILQ